MFCTEAFSSSSHFVPEGQVKIAQHFSAGSAVPERSTSPGGTTETRSPDRRERSAVPPGLDYAQSTQTQLKCWAIIECPSGAELSCKRDLCVSIHR